jgi:hypothetical protein
MSPNLIAPKSRCAKAERLLPFMLLLLLLLPVPVPVPVPVPEEKITSRVQLAFCQFVFVAK